MPTSQFGRPARAPPRLLLLAGLFALGGLALLGLPGAAWLELASPVAGLLTDRRAEADAAWPMAILHTLLWPWLLLPAYDLAAPRFEAGWPRVLVTMLFTILGALLVAVIMQVSGGQI